MFLESLVKTSIQGGIVIALLYVALKIAPSLPPKLKVWLWRIVMLKMAIGLIPLGSVTLKVLPKTADPISAPPVSSQAEVFSPPIRQTPTTLTPSAVALPEAIPQNEPPAVDPWLALYAASAAAIGAWSLTRTRKLRRIARQAWPAADRRALTDLRDLSNAAGLRNPPILLESDGVATAFVIGWRRPAILLPTERRRTEDQRLILAHEIAHLRHGDLLWNGFASAVQTLFFFHPLAWLATASYRAAQESAADRAAIQLTNSSPRRYAEMLVRETIVARPSLLSATAGMSVARSIACTQQRLKAMKYLDARPTLAKTVLTVALFAACLGAVPAYRLGEMSVPAGIDTSLGAHVQQSPSSTAKKSAHPAKPPAKSKAAAKAKKAAKAKPATKAAPAVKAKPAVPAKPATPKAPTTTSTPQVVDLSLDNASAHEAIRALFQLFGRSASVAPSVDGKVTFFAHRAKFDESLRNILNQLGATYHIDGDIYVITSTARPPLTRRAIAAFFNTAGPGQPISGDMNQGDVREGLRQLFRVAQLRYSIAPDVLGTVTVSMKNVSFEAALQNILSQVGATYRIRGGVYEVMSRAQADTARNEPSSKISGRVEGNLDQLDFEQADIRQTLRKLFQFKNTSYSIAPEVQGTVTLSLRNVTFEVALMNILRQVDATYRIEGGVYMIVHLPVGG